MPSTPERTPRERETLLFPTQEEGAAFRERVGEKLSNAEVQGVHKQQEIVAAAVAEQFEAHGEGVQSLKQPWIHSPEEHDEAQRLVDVVFTKDLGIALQQARKSKYYPRNIDLLHDVLTSELYQLVQQEKMNTQSVGWAAFLSVIIVLIAILVGVLVIVV